MQREQPLGRAVRQRGGAALPLLRPGAPRGGVRRRPPPPEVPLICRPRNPLRTRLRFAALVALAVSSCASGPATRAPAAAAAVAEPGFFSIAPTTRRLQVLHASDTEAEVLSKDGVGGVARFRSVVDAL